MSKFVGYSTREGWSGALPFYSFKCEKHGLVCDYPHGHYLRLSCPLCVRDESQIKKPEIHHVVLSASMQKEEYQK